MTLFVSVAALLLLLTLALLATALRRSTLDAITADQEADADERERINVRLYHERAAELEREQANGAISEDQYQQAQQELQRDLLHNQGRDVVLRSGGGRWLFPLILLTLPVAAGGLYWQLGNTLFLEGVAAAAAVQQMRASAQGPDIGQMVKRLQQRLEENPADAEGWSMLGRSLSVLERYEESANAYRKALELTPNDADLHGQYAESLGLARGGRLEGEPAAAAARALALDPENPMGLWLTGMAAYQVGERAQAVATWQHLQQVLPADDPSQQSLARVIAQATAAISGTTESAPTAAAAASDPTPPPAAAATNAITLQVSLAPAIADGLSGEETLFVFARAPGGRMPLVIERHRVADLPLQLTLDNRDAMAGGNPLSTLSEVEVVARISRSGGVVPQSGDREGVMKLSLPISSRMELMIDQRLP